MKYLKKKEKKLFPWIIVIVLLVFLVACAMLLISAKRPKTPSAAAPETVTAEVGKPVKTDVTETTGEEYPPVQIETPYCELYYPGQWAEGLETEVTGEAYDTVVTFFADVAGKQYTLFHICFGGAEGFPVGILETSDGVMLDVTLEIAEIEFDSNLNQEEVDRVCAMQEAMNYVIDRMNELSGFTPVG